MGRHLTEADKKFIQENSHNMTDQQIAGMLGTSIRTVEENRKKLGIKKTRKKRNLGQINKKSKKEIDRSELPQMSFDPEQIHACATEADYKYWRIRLLQSPKGRKIKNMLTPEDWDVFVEEWCAFHLQFEDLTHTEETTVEHIIYLRLRILQNQRDVFKALKQKNTLGDINVATLNMDDEEQHQKFVKLQALDSHISDLNKEYRELLEKANNLFKSLAGTREQREKKGAVTRETFWSLVEEFKKEDVRSKEGRMAELLKTATEKNMDKLRRTIEFADGEMGPQLLDTETVRQMKEQTVKNKINAEEAD